MKNLIFAAVVISLLTACAVQDAAVRSDTGIYCRTYARQTGSTQSPDEEALFRECMHLRGGYEVVVK